MVRIGIDLGGTKIEGLAMGPSGEELARSRVQTPAGDYAATLQAIRSLVDSLEETAGARAPAVGVGTPGGIDPRTGLIHNANSTCLIGHPLDKDLEALLERPVRLANDADCFALSEAADGAAAGRRVVFGVILGTGVGGGLVIDGKLVSGPNNIQGEWGHNPLPWPQDTERPGPPCYCGRRGCLETFLSGPGLTLDHEASSGERLVPPDIVRRAEAGDAACEASLSRYEDRLARGLAAVINIIDPHAVVLGGGMSNIKRLYNNIPRLWKGRVFCAEPSTALLEARHGDSSGVRGACRLL
ncbi:MAG: ROK family protein [Elusimicrobia bacterium]|nr:ROK family protein [Elusimicrobiota bacterium]